MELKIILRDGYRRTVAPFLSTFHYVGVEEYFLGFASDLARIETGGVFAKQEQNLSEAFLESEGGPDDPDRAPQFARGIFEIAELGVKR